MTITARYPGKCNRCGRSIQVGDQINWVKGVGSEHVTCPTAKTSAAAAPKTTNTSQPKVPASKPARTLQPGEQFISRPSQGRDDDGYETGRTYRFARIPGGGGPEGRYWTVTASGKYRVTEAQNDTREGEWDCWAHARPATDAEVAPVAERIAAAEAEKVAKKDAEAARDAAWRQTVANLTAGLEATGYGPMIYQETLKGAELLAQAPDGIRSAAYQHAIDAVYRLDSDIVTVNRYDWIVRRYTTPERATRLRNEAILTAAEEKI